MTALDVISTVIVVANWFVLAYFLLLNTSYLGLILLAVREFRRHLRRRPYAGFDEAYTNPLTLGVSVVMPAHNEEATIVESVNAMLALRHPLFEVVVVDDGSTDGTFEVLRAHFGLVEVPRVVPDDVPTRGAITAVHAPPAAVPLVVVRKENGGKASANNTGINVAVQPLVCMVDADSLLDPDALLAVARPFGDDPEHVVATGGVVRAVNDSTVVAGRVTELRMPRTWLARTQVVEYLRAFLLGRSGWSALNALVVVSGAFGLFRRDVLVETGGLDVDTIGEDAELVVRLHRWLRDHRRHARVVFVPEPVAWTEVPESLRVLGRQRRRWSRGLAEVLWKHRRMIGNPAYGAVGTLALPFYVLFELLAPVVELFGLVALVVGLLLGAVDWAFAVLFFLVALGYGVALSLVALVVEEYSFHRYRGWRDLAVALVVAVVENIGYRQLTAVWRLRGLVDALRGGKAEWGRMTRVGFASAEPAGGPVPGSGPVTHPGEVVPDVR
ncbi:glycosyltransferase family 2 protein [Lentzea jiangxiensis]|uniref:Glycosyltransferase, catalytic subunit of cellulose synthase and poly-beta-1,6-N-acetylglucosamine synthase n=1 Tax=Lentzea jiangxiensis TaxID=641025 RepID=A0A1H0VSB6_9PSEU|nr:glycosyltransferase [Lentzea jiangxiensis]SDP81141.1 Glycosyltransferase, catalytic subunit of cellulose synthase and poly-beta-1,6-N-acetylglucosamine synthase [Lentzea jiangxiensis]